jgi:hypothetical protein
VVPGAGTAPLRELATETRLAGAVTGVLLDTYRGFPVHAPRQVFAGPAVAIADGAGAVTGIEVLRDREALFGAAASVPPPHGGCWTGSMSRTWSGCGQRGRPPGSGPGRSRCRRGKACGCDWCGEPGSG